MYISPGFSAQRALEDMRTGLGLSEVWRNFALEDLRKRYIRSYAGLWWIFLSFGAFVFIKAVIFTPLSPETLKSFTPYVTIGFFAWVFMQSVISEGSNVFIGAANWLKGARLPLTVFVLQSVVRNCILTLFNFVVVVIVLVMTRTPVDAMWLLAIPISGLYLITAVWVTALFGIIGARFRDFVHLVVTLMRMAIFLTPIFWMPKQMGGLWEILKYNPLAHYIILLREPLLEGTIPWTSLWVVLAITFGGMAVTIWAFAAFRSRVPYWI